ncbi:MAG: hypothetical protein E6Q34_06885 [Burkholderiaceae bacterium]|nr:MAG: hypothetical protein E6Q34_06885 [Burkholderiaceae bacterium]
MRLFLLPIFALLAGIAQAQVPVENLLLRVPDNYTSASNTQKENFSGIEYIPKTESLTTWSEMLTVQTFRNLSVGLDVFRENLERGFKRSCKESSSALVSEANEFGYDAKVWMQTCEYANKTPRDEIVLFKAIRGKEATYVIQKAFRFEPSVEKLTPWFEYMKKVRLCGAESNEPDCEPLKKKSISTPATTVTPIFGELFVMKLLPQFREQGVQTNANSFVRVMLLNTDDNIKWTQRVLLSATKLEGKDETLSPREKAISIATGFNQACPTSFFAKPLGSAKIASGHDAYFALASCGTHTMTNSKTPTNETALIAVIKAKLNFYVLQWSERGPASEVALSPNVELWQQRVRSMAPFAVCPEIKGEGAPYPSCFKSLEVK